MLGQLLLLLALALSLAPAPLLAQYSPQAFQMKAAQDLYDERGFLQGASIAVDGNLAISNQNGTPSYSYPISSFTSGGHPVTTRLNYCGSVQFTAFKDYNLAHKHLGDIYGGWARYHTNRPAWILSVNNWAVNLIGCVSHFTAPPGSRLFNNGYTEYDDADILLLADGYDFSNRMRDFGAVAQEENFQDVIRILRGDGSVMELLNIHTRTEIGERDTDTIAALYTGYYFVNEANARGYGLVSYDSSQFLGAAWQHMASQVVAGDRAPLHPRLLRYFPGDGSEVVFKEYLAPFGSAAYRDLEQRSGGLWGGPTIFYLEEIRSNAGTVVAFHRARHDARTDNSLTGTTTRGRAPVTSFTGHEIRLGDQSMVIEALGRTTKVRFGLVMRNGTAVAAETMPYARLGGATAYAQQVAEYAESDSRLYRGFTGYVTDILDPADRLTTFSYEQVTRRYQTPGFPHSNGPVRLSLKNYRLTGVTEPTASYALSYYGGLDVAIEPTEVNPMVLNNVVDSVRKSDRSGALLTTDVYTFDQTNLGHQSLTGQRTTDHVSGFTKQTSFLYENYRLSNYAPLLSPGRHTVLRQRVESASDGRGGWVEVTSSTSYRTGDDVPSWGGIGAYTVLPVSQVRSINGIVQSHQEYSYDLATVREFWRTPGLAARYGREITRRVTRTLKPDDASQVLLVDTTTYLHLPVVDTVVQVQRVRWNKLATLANFFRLRDTLYHEDVVGRSWEEVMYRPPVAAFDQEPVSHHTAPPIFGLAERSWQTAADGAVSGVRNVYLTDILQDGELAARGGLVADSVLGSDDARMLKGAYSYRQEWSGPLLRSRRTAIGVETRYGYGWNRCGDVPYWQECQESSTITGMVVANDGSVGDESLKWSPFSYWFSKPMTEQVVVRRYDELGVLRYDTLRSHSQRTHYGQVSASVDMNGYYSRYDYDYNGRLKVGWLPLDFPGTDITALPPFEGDEPIDLLGTTYHHRRNDILRCFRDGNSQRLEGDVQQSVHYDTLYARLPLTLRPPCIACDDPASVRRREESGGADQTKEHSQRTLQAAPCRDEEYAYDEYGGQKGFVGHLQHLLDARSPIRTAKRIDSLHLETMMTAIDGECVHLEVAVGALFSKTFVLMCASGEPPVDPPQGRIIGGKGGSDRTALASGVTPVAGGYRLIVDLSTIAAQLASLPEGSLLEIELRVKTAGAAVGFVNGTNAEDLRPRLHVYGEHAKVWDQADYTLAYEHDDRALKMSERAKVDDAAHSANDLAAQEIAVRRSLATNVFGAEYRLLRSERTVVEPGGSRIDVSRTVYTGLGAATTIVDADGDSIVTRYDGLNRPIETVNADGTKTSITYQQLRPAELGITDQEFYGFCELTISTDENGTKGARIADAFGRLRREIADYGNPATHSNTTVRYEYDLLGRLVEVINPKGDRTHYSYDAFGRVATKSHPDLGTVSYGYDDLGNVRFTQDAEQARKNLLGFNQYDDLNRLVVLGEAYIDEDDKCGRYNEDDLTGSGGCGDGSRLTDRLDGNRLAVAGYDGPVTVNPTLLHTPSAEVPTFAAIESFQFKDCSLDPEPRLGETEAPRPPFVMHPTQMYTPRNGGVAGASLASFEDLAAHPEFARIGIAYDQMPERAGAIWSAFPALEQWNRLAPSGAVRNQKGVEAAVAYRDKASEPFHYAVMSYDERGRVEALLRYTENLGFDAVYYQYNSANDVIAVMVADPWRRFTTWYGYDQQGRIDSVWSRLDGPSSGLLAGGDFTQQSFPGYAEHGDRLPDLVYSYTRTDQVRRLEYPTIETLVEYAYNHRKFLESLVATREGKPVFAQMLRYDASGQIIEQEYRQGSGSAKKQVYTYDGLDRLVGWSLEGAATQYGYDPIGSRERVQHPGRPIETYAYAAGTNRLSLRRQPDYAGGDTTNAYSYNANGAQVRHVVSYDTPQESRILREEQFGYSFRGLNNRARVRTAGGRWQDWRYRSNAMGEREQKRLYEQSGSIVPAPDSVVYPWVYYLLGGSKQQHAVYHGQQLDSLQTECGDLGKNRVYLYAQEYISYGASDVGLVTTRPTGRKEYKLADHLGSTRAVLDEQGVVIGSYDLAPFGEVIATTGVKSRKGFIDKETDQETATGNFGVRQYNAEEGRFTSVDPLWEKYPFVSPYHYCFNNPLGTKDPSGADTSLKTAVIDGLTDAAKGIGETILEACPAYALYKHLTEPASEGFTKTIETVKSTWSVATGEKGEYAQVRLLVGAGTQAAFWGTLGGIGGASASKLRMSGLGDLTASEAKAIQQVVNRAGRPLEVVGSAARGARTAASDIDYVVPPSSLKYFEGLEQALPKIDMNHGIISGVGNPNMGPVIRFEPTAIPTP